MYLFKRQCDNCPASNAKIIIDQKVKNMSVSSKDVHYVANLARLQLSEEEAESLKGDMNKILGYIDTLNELDTTDVKPLEHVMEITATTFRKDVANEPLSHDDALKNAPDADSDYFRVPRVIE